VKAGESMGNVASFEVYIQALKLMGEESEDGTDYGYSTEYQKKAWTVLTILQAELLPHADVEPIVGDDQYLQVDDRTARMLLPYGLAAHLLMEEDQNRAAFFNARYDELKRKKTASVTPITDVYSVTSGMG
jgi:hypothetical protein